MIPASMDREGKPLFPGLARRPDGIRPRPHPSPRRRRRCALGSSARRSV